MAAIGAYAEKVILDWTLTPTSSSRAGGCFVALATAAPTSLASSEVATGSGYAAQTCGFAAAASPAGSASNTVAMTFGPFSSAQSISGVVVKDTLSSGAGNNLYYGLLATARTVGPGDSLVIASGALTITLA